MLTASWSRHFTAASRSRPHPRQPAGGGSTDPADLTRLIATAAGHGTDIGVYAERLLDHPLPWTLMRQVYRLLGLVKCYARLVDFDRATA